MLRARRPPARACQDRAFVDNGVMKEIWQGRVGQAAGKYADNAPLATACCNACRTCMTTNAVGFLVVAAGSVGVALAKVTRRLTPRFARPSS